MSKRFSNWASLSPWSIISFSLQTLKTMVNNGYAMIPIVYTGWQQGFSSPWMIIAIVSVIIAIFTFAIAQWAQYRYRLIDAKLGIKQGILFKSAHEIPLNKIQNVRLEQPLYFRPLGLFSLVVETAGSKKDEAVLSAINYRQAMQLKKQLFQRSAATTNGINVQELSQTDSINNHGVVVRKSLKDLLFFGLYQNNLFWLSIISGSILGQLDWSKVGQSPLAVDALDWYQNNIATSLLNELLFGLLALVSLYLLLSLISITSAVLKYHPYQLSLRHNTLHRTGGLLAKQQDALVLARVQLIRFEQPIIGRIIKLWTVNFKQVQGTEVEQMAKRHMLIPSMSQQQIAETLPQLTGLSSNASALPTHYNGIYFGWFWRRALLPVVISIIALLVAGPNPFTELLWLGSMVFVIGLYLKYRQWGYHLQGDDLWIHTGVLGQSWQLISLKKVQHVCISQTLGQKKKQLATLYIGLASGEQKIPYFPIEDARLIAETALSLTKHDHTNWI
ncbi:PH domain-containing protein [Shewanella psychrotolerans]|nr:PH domain-containing protein [Shewanella psychrotolerans]QYK03353.1 PH domain-containing protein [Shewanella psychrotolerans]